jgi:hypothetical protein
MVYRKTEGRVSIYVNNELIHNIIVSDYKITIAKKYFINNSLVFYLNAYLGYLVRTYTSR